MLPLCLIGDAPITELQIQNPESRVRKAWQRERSQWKSEEQVYKKGIKGEEKKIWICKQQIDEVTSFKNKRHLWVKLFTEVKRLLPPWTSVSVPMPTICQLILSPRHKSRPSKLPNTLPLIPYILLLFTNPPSVFFFMAPSGSVQNCLIFLSRSQLLFSSITVNNTTKSLFTSVRAPVFASKVPFLQVKIAPVRREKKLKFYKTENKLGIILTTVLNKIPIRKKLSLRYAGFRNRQHYSPRTEIRGYCKLLTN